jgi:hypothetical protein
MRRDLRFILVCSVLFLIGGALRLVTGGLNLPWSSAGASLSLAASAAGTGAEQVPPEVAATVLDFYRAVDKGRYAEAFALALEDRWSESADGAYQVDGLVSEDQFVTALTDELGANGMELNIISIQAVDQVALSPAEQMPERHPELGTLKFLPAPTRVERVYRVYVKGTLLGRCSRWDWDKHVLVAQFKGQGWRVLLPGVKGPHQPHNEEWFLDRNP